MLTTAGGFLHHCTSDYERGIISRVWYIVNVRTYIDRGKGVPSFDEMVDFALVEVDFDDPTTNVRGRRALAIAKPTPRGY